MTADHPTPAEHEIRERAKGPLHEALHTLEPRIPNLYVGDCHCNLLAEVVLDALMPTFAAELARRDAALADLTRQRDEQHSDLETYEAEVAKLNRDINELGVALGKAERERDSLARRCAVRFEETEKLRAQLERQAPVIEAARQLVECERLLATQKAMLGEEYRTCQHQTDLAAAISALGPVDPEATAQPAERGEETNG